MEKPKTKKEFDTIPQLSQTQEESSSRITSKHNEKRTLTKSKHQRVSPSKLINNILHRHELTHDKGNTNASNTQAVTKMSLKQQEQGEK
ncbi:hypothetical protein H5410_027848 [Solanum commersonii]|uniref:Uncharacterized protein n=1 Tax=Solanum commersonii TaxID=4109 RepID=A0A9J5Z4J4_SOLCO|nr:hypothetical protein H5410_027848 [Solanum commersonii]